MGPVPVVEQRSLLEQLLTATALDLGSGRVPRAGYLGLDNQVQEPEAWERVLRFDLASGEPWPFLDGQIESLYSSHFIEHVPAVDVDGGEVTRRDAVYYDSAEWDHSLFPNWRVGNPRRIDALAWVFEEAWRVCQPGAVFELSWPSLVNEQTGAISLLPFWDPTHRRFIPRHQLLYFSRESREKLGVESYGYRCNWTIVREVQREIGHGCEYYVELRRDP